MAGTRRLIEAMTGTASLNRKAQLTCMHQILSNSLPTRAGDRGSVVMARCVGRFQPVCGVLGDDTLRHIDQARWDEVWAEDLDVLRNLRKNGDNPHVPREIDVSFRGSMNSLKRLEAACSNFGFEVQELIETDEEGRPWLFLVRTQTADEDAIRDLTMTYLQIEDSFGVKCDGWGCLGQTEK